MIDASGRDIRLQVDGGVTAANIKVCHQDIFAIYIFMYKNKYTLS
jgi:pentose-5-phosphate-3-epimerase